MALPPPLWDARPQSLFLTNNLLLIFHIEFFARYRTALQLLRAYRWWWRRRWGAGRRRRGRRAGGTHDQRPRTPGDDIGQTPMGAARRRRRDRRGHKQTVQEVLDERPDRHPVQEELYCPPGGVRECRSHWPIAIGPRALTGAYDPPHGGDYAHPGLLALASCALLRASNTCPRGCQRT